MKIFSDKSNKRLRFKYFNLLSNDYCLLSSNSAFTLIELLVAITILATLIAGAIFTINPRSQIEKAQDARRQEDMGAIKDALELYYHDKSCYPLGKSSITKDFIDALTKGSEWSDKGTVYMKKIPLDPGTKESYSYLTDNSTQCPQWIALFAKESKPAVIDSRTGATATCSLPSSGSNKCVPEGYDPTWGCVVSGISASKCPFASTDPVVQTGYSLIKSPSTQAVVPSGPPTTFDIAMAPGSNPSFYKATVATLSGKMNQTQTVTASASDLIADIASVSAIVKTDTKIQNYSMTQISGTPTDGTWTASWKINDTAKIRFMITLFGINKAGNSKSVDIAIK